MTDQASAPTPITLIGGYLGSGKTTLINRLLNSGRLAQQTAILVNDFGDINVDEQLIRSGSKNERVIGLANGCICCSIADDLSGVLERLKSTDVQHVIIECSGVAEPIKARRQCHYPGFYPQACVVLVDAEYHTLRSRDKYVGSIATAQVEQADLIVINKSSSNPNFRLEALRPSVTTEDEDVLQLVMGWRGVNAELGLSGVNQLPKFVSQTWRQEQTVSRNQLCDYLDKLPESIQRVKGIVQTDGGLVEVQCVGAHISTRTYDANSQPEIPLGLVFIGYSSAALPTETLAI